jgi:hypothetical protein
MNTSTLKKKELYLAEFSKTINPKTHWYLSFYEDESMLKEFEELFNIVTTNYGNKHLGIYRICDAEYIYCVGRKLPYNLSVFQKIRFLTKTFLIACGIINQKTGHANYLLKEYWTGEHYSKKEKKLLKGKYIEDLQKLAKEGFLAPHLVYSPAHFSEEYIQPILNYLKSNKIELTKSNYFPFYFVYIMLNVERYKNLLYKNRNVLIITAFNERNKPENFTANLSKEGVKNLYFYNISHDKALLEVIDKEKLPDDVDLVLIGAGIGSVNIINQLGHLNALCIDAGHALDCLSRPQLRKERIFLLPDDQISN